MIDRINQLLEEIAAIQIKDANELEAFRLKYLSRKGLLNDLFEDFKKIPNTEKKETGQVLNILKQKTQAKFDEAESRFSGSSDSGKSQLDYTLPGPDMKLGSRHPLNIVMEDMLKVFGKLGFTIATGPEIEDDWHNFT